MTEQVDANKELADLLTKLERTTMHRNADGSKVALCDGLGLHIIDNELNAKFEKCFCGNSYGNYGKIDGCKTKCPESSKICGGLKANSVYEVNR